MQTHAKNAGSTRQGLSKAGVRDELDASLEGGFQFDGDYYIEGQLPAAPNPCLAIQGIGQVGLPLSERDAKSIVQLLSKPSGRGKKASRKAKEPQLWEIKADQVTFENDGWNQYMGRTIAKFIWAGLVGAKPANLPKCQLDRLLLYETGSGSLSTQTSGTPDGTFATAMLVLPSSHEGGQIQLTHPGASDSVIDLLPKSGTSPSIFAWYSEVKHEVWPVTSGYRLALLYNVIHTCTPSSFPQLPTMDRPISKFRAALTYWKGATFGDDERKLNAFAYVFKHTYTSVGLHGSGAEILKRQDSHLIMHARGVAEELGFVVLLGALDYQPQEASDDEGMNDDYDDYGASFYSSRKRARYGCAGYNATDGIELKLEELVDLAGRKVMDDRKVEIKMENLLPKNVSLSPTDPMSVLFAAVSPVPSLMSPQGNRTTDPFNRHLAMILLHPNHIEEFFFAGGGVSYALAQLEKSTSNIPSDSDKKLTRLVVEGIDPWDIQTADAMLPYALRWQDLKLWTEIMSRVMSKEQYTLEKFGLERPVSTLQAFAFKDVCAIFETLLKSSKSLKTRLEFIDVIKCSGTNTEVRQWCKTQERQVLRSFTDPKVEDIQSLVKVAERRGTLFISKVVLPQVAKKATECHGFLVDLTKALHQKQNDIPTSSSTSSDTLEWKPFLDQLLSIIIEACPRLSVSEYHYHWSGENYSLQRYVDVLELGIITGQLNTCSKLVQQIVDVSGDTTNKLRSIYIPFVPKLSKVCRNANLDILTFRELLNQIVPAYLEKILGPSSQQHLAKVRKLGCGCKLCVELDTFIANTGARDISFKENKGPRSHLESRIKAATDILQFHTLNGRPGTLVITKTSDMVAAQEWPRRQKAAKDFLASIGDDNTIAKLMGDRYNDVQLALSGAKPFVATSNASMPLAIQLPNLTSTVAGASAVSTGKRKRT